MSISLMIAIIVMGGWGFSRVFQRIKAPSILGMLLWGIAVNKLWNVHIPSALWDMAPFFTSLALIVILLRAGLGINRAMLRKTGISAILMGFVPCLVEALGLTFSFYYLMGFSWIIAAMSAFILSAVSPAVVVPSMLNLKASGYGKKKQIPTLVLAGASVDDVVAFSLFTICLNMAQVHSANIQENLLKIPLSLLGGVLAGTILGFALIKFYRLTMNKLRATERLLILIALSFFLLELGTPLGIAALLGTMTMGFIIFEKETKIAHELSDKLVKWWIIAEVILFVLIGMKVETTYIWEAGFKGLAAIVIGLVFRSLGVIIATAFSKLNKREKAFCVIAYIPKATVQAALGAVPLSMGIPHGHVILAVAVISILFTAPLGLFLIQVFGKRLLQIDN